MNKRLFLTLGIAASFAAGAPLTALAAKKDPAATPVPAATPAATPAPKPAATPEPAKEASAKPVPFHGKVTAVDAAAKTFSMKGKDKDRVFSVTDETAVIGKDGAASTLAAIPVGEEVRGSAMKSGENWTAKKVIIGAKEGSAKGKAAATPATPAKPGSPADSPKKSQ